MIVKTGFPDTSANPDMILIWAGFLVVQGSPLGKYPSDGLFDALGMF